MSESLVICPACKERRRLVSIRQLAGDEVRRFHCDTCKADADYIVRRGGAMIRVASN